MPPSITQLQDIQFWRTLHPDLHVLDETFARSIRMFETEAPSPQTSAAHLTTDGYFRFHVTPTQWQISLSHMRDAIKKMTADDIMPIFGFVYDEFWLMYIKLRHTLAHILGNDYLMLPDFWIWHIDPLKGEGGFPPHRDRIGETFAKDRPNSLTVWIPLSNATPDNSCIYIVPIDKDPTYNTPQDATWNIQYQDIRALPAQPGDVLCWTTSALHWGSQANPRAASSEPRISVGVEFQRADVPIYRQPALNPLMLPSFPQRLRLIAAQLLTYKGGRGHLPPHIDAFATSLLALQQNQ